MQRVSQRIKRYQITFLLLFIAYFLFACGYLRQNQEDFFYKYSAYTLKSNIPRDLYINCGFDGYLDRPVIMSVPSKYIDGHIGRYYKTSSIGSQILYASTRQDIIAHEYFHHLSQNSEGASRDCLEETAAYLLHRLVILQLHLNR